MAPVLLFQNESQMSFQGFKSTPEGAFLTLLWKKIFNFSLTKRVNCIRHVHFPRFKKHRFIQGLMFYSLNKDQHVHNGEALLLKLPCQFWGIPSSNQTETLQMPPLSVNQTQLHMTVFSSSAQRKERTMCVRGKFSICVSVTAIY